MPKTAVNVNGDPGIREYEIGAPGERQMPSPSSQSCKAKGPNNSKFGSRVTATPNARHDL